jgi:glutathione S-transferase
MSTLTHFSFCPRSRAIRLALAERGIDVAFAEERPWTWSPALLALNPAGEVPVLQQEDGIVVCGAYAIAEYLAIAPATDPEAGDPDHRKPLALLPGNPAAQAEVRRLVDWFHFKLDREVTAPLLEAHVLPLFKGTAHAAPEPEVLRAAHANLAYHLGYVSWLSDQRNWLAGDALSYADLAAAGHISCLDYLGEIDWARFAPAKVWYQRLKSRRSFQGLLADRVPGRLPSAVYTELDF